MLHAFFGLVVGEFTVLDSEGTGISHACRWKDGRKQDLGTVAGDSDSITYAINHKGQVVGGSGSGFIDLPFNSVHAFLWEQGVLTDLNTLIPANADLQLIVAYGINAHGQIAALAYEFSTGTIRALLLNPDDSTSASQGTASAAQTATAQRPQVILPENVRNLLQRATSDPHIKADGIRNRLSRLKFQLGPAAKAVNALINRTPNFMRSISDYIVRRTLSSCLAMGAELCGGPNSNES